MRQQYRPLPCPRYSPKPPQQSQRSQNAQTLIPFPILNIEIAVELRSFVVGRRGCACEGKAKKNAAPQQRNTPGPRWRHPVRGGSICSNTIRSAQKEKGNTHMSG